MNPKVAAAQTTCKRGHSLLDNRNLILQFDKRWHKREGRYVFYALRHCRACGQMRSRAWRLAQGDGLKAKERARWTKRTIRKRGSR